MSDTKNAKGQTKRALLGILFVVIAMAIYGYYEVILKHQMNGSTLIDNPTSQAISINLDGITYQIPANDFVKVQVNKGIHTLNSDELNLKDVEINLEPTQYGVINPTKSKYVIYEMIYTKKDLTDQFQAYQVEGKEIYSLLGEPEVTQELFIPDGTLGRGNLDDKIPEFIKYDKKTQDYAFLQRIFRLEDFFKYYEKNNK